MFFLPENQNTQNTRSSNIITDWQTKTCIHIQYIYIYKSKGEDLDFKKLHNLRPGPYALLNTAVAKQRSPALCAPVQ